MGRNLIFIAGLILFDGLAVAWAGWEFWKLRPGKTGKAATPEAISAFSRAKTPADLPEAPGHPEGEHGPDHR